MLPWGSKVIILVTLVARGSYHVYIYPFPLPPPLTLLLLPSPLSPLSPSRTPPLLPSPDRGTPSRGVWDSLTFSLNATVVGNPMGQYQSHKMIMQYCVWLPIATSCGASMREAPFMYIYTCIYTHVHILYINYIHSIYT